MTVSLSCQIDVVRLWNKIFQSPRHIIPDDFKIHNIQEIKYYFSLLFKRYYRNDIFHFNWCDSKRIITGTRELTIQLSYTGVIEFRMDPDFFKGINIRYGYISQVFLYDANKKNNTDVKEINSNYGLNLPDDILDWSKDDLLMLEMVI